MNIEEITRLRSSLAYKHYGIPWLKDVPDHWNVPRLKTHLVLNDSGVWSEEPDDRGTTVLRSTEQTIDGHWNIRNPARLRIGERERDVATLVTGDLVITKSSGSSAHIGKTTLVDDEVSSLRCCFSNFMQRVRTGDGVRPRFLWYYFNSYIGREQLLARATTTTGLANLNGRIIGNARIPIPPPHEQYTIVRYLDDADQRIRAYVSAKERLIALLEEERQAVIHQAVTKGLDPNVKLKPSGVEWLGEVPEQWTVRRLKTLCSMKSGDGITTEAIEATGRYPVYGGNGLRGYTTEFTHDGRYALIGRQGALCGNVHTTQGKFWASEHAVVASPHSANNMEWFVALLEAMNLNQYSISAAQPGLAVERIVNLWAPFPPHREQSRIGGYIAQITATINDATDRTRRQIELMEEYRTRLIADVVTGKLDVREAKP